MAITIDNEELAAIVKVVTQEVIKQLDIEAIARTAAERSAVIVKEPKKKFYTTRETAAIMGITVGALAARRLKGAIKGIPQDGSNRYMYSREEIARACGTDKF